MTFEHEQTIPRNCLLFMCCPLSILCFLDRIYQIRLLDIICHKMQQSIHMTKSSKYCKCTRTLEWEDKYLATRYVSNLGTITCFSEHGMIDMCFCSNEANSCYFHHEMYSCNKITTAQILISRQNWNGFFSNINHWRTLTNSNIF